MFNKYLVIEQLFIYSPSFQFVALGFFLMAQSIIKSHFIKNIAIFSWFWVLVEKFAIISLGLWCSIRRFLVLCDFCLLAALGSYPTWLQLWPLSSMEACPVPRLSHENSSEFLYYDDVGPYIRPGELHLGRYLFIVSYISISCQTKTLWGVREVPHSY